MLLVQQLPKQHWNLSQSLLLLVLDVCSPRVGIHEGPGVGIRLPENRMQSRLWLHLLLRRANALCARMAGQIFYLAIHRTAQRKHLWCQHTDHARPTSWIRRTALRRSRIRSTSALRQILIRLLSFLSLIKRRIINPWMCQGLLCFQTAYFSCCYQWVGCSVGFLCCSCWLCPSLPIAHMRGSHCCKCSTSSGCGCSSLCAAFYCCIPSILRDYSIWSSVENRVGELYNMVINRQAVVEKEK